MRIVKVLKYLNSADGPRIPMRTLAAYCGTDEGSICMYINGKRRPKEETERQLEQGVRELVLEINNECKWLFDRRV